MRKAILITGILLLILFLKPLISYSQQSQNTRFRLLTYGMPNFAKQNSENIIADNWGIEFYPVTGCEITIELEDSIEHCNKKVEALIQKKYGKDWRSKFDKEVETEFEIEKKVTDLIGQLSYVKSKQAELDKEGNGLHFFMTPVINTKRYSVVAQGWGKWKGQIEWVTYYKLLVDYKAKTVKLLSDKIVKA